MLAAAKAEKTVLKLRDGWDTADFCIYTSNVKPVKNRQLSARGLCASFSLRVFHGWGIPPKPAPGAAAVPRRGAAKGSASPAVQERAGRRRLPGALRSLPCAADEKCSPGSRGENGAVPARAALLRLLLAAPPAAPGATAALQRLHPRTHRSAPSIPGRGLGQIKTI